MYTEKEKEKIPVCKKIKTRYYEKKCTDWSTIVSLFLYSPHDLSVNTVPDPLVREVAKLLFETNHCGVVERMKYEPTLYFNVSGGRMEGTVPDLYVELKHNNPMILEASGIIPDSIPSNGQIIDPKERQKRVMATQGLDYRVWYGGDILGLQQLYPGYSFMLTELPNSSLYVAVAA